MSITVPNYRLPRVYQWNLTLQQSLGSTGVFSLAYVASSAHALEHREQFIFNAGPGLPSSPNFSQLSVTSNNGASNYNSLQAQVQSHVAKVLEMQAAYTWSHAIDNGTSNMEFNSMDPRIDRGNSDYDVRNSVSAAATYNLPSYNRGLFSKALLTGWAVNSIFGAHSSPPFNINARTFTVGASGTNYTERADLVPGEPVWINARSVGGYLVPGGKYVNPAAFTNPGPTEAQGDLGRNSLRGFGYWQLDFGVHRMFPITEGVHLQFRAEAFNIFNHPNFANPNGLNATLGAPLPGSLGNTLGFGESPSSLASGLGGGSNNGGFNPLFQSGGPRALQLALRVVF